MALTPLIVAVLRPAPSTSRTTRRAFGLGLLTGIGYFSGTLYWLVETMTTFGGLGVPVALVAAGLLVAYLSLFPAAFAVVLARLRMALGVRGAVLCAAPVWVTTELGRQYLWDGFPWALLGYSQVTVLPIAQLASLTGVYGLSFLLALTSAAVALADSSIQAAPDGPSPSRSQCWSLPAQCGAGGGSRTGRSPGRATRFAWPSFRATWPRTTSGIPRCAIRSSAGMCR